MPRTAPWATTWYPVVSQSKDPRGTTFVDSTVIQPAPSSSDWAAAVVQNNSPFSCWAWTQAAPPPPIRSARSGTYILGFDAPIVLPPGASATVLMQSSGIGLAVTDLHDTITIIFARAPSGPGAGIVVTFFPDTMPPALTVPSADLGLSSLSVVTGVPRSYSVTAGGAPTNIGPPVGMGGNLDWYTGYVILAWAMSIQVATNAGNALYQTDLFPTDTTNLLFNNGGVNFSARIYGSGASANTAVTVHGESYTQPYMQNGLPSVPVLLPRDVALVTNQMQASLSLLAGPAANVGLLAWAEMTIQTFTTLR